MIKKLYWFLFELDLNGQTAQQQAVLGVSNKIRLRRDMAWLLLITYLLLIFKSCLPVAADLLAHTFWEKEHLATEHHLAGNNHVGLSLKAMDNRENKDKNAGIVKSAYEDALHIAHVFQLSVLTAYVLLPLIYHAYQVNWHNYVLGLNYPPPKF